MVSDEEVFRFVVPGRLEYRDAARGFLDFVCRQLQEKGRLSGEACDHVLSAFVEAFNNAVVHAYRDAPGGVVETELRVTSREVVVCITDEGRAFSFDEVVPPELDALPEGGLGLYIMKSFMDEVRYEPGARRNRLSMRKALAPPGVC